MRVRSVTPQALQHPWLVKATSGEDLEECSLSWDEEDDEYAVSRSMSNDSD